MYCTPTACDDYGREEGPVAMDCMDMDEDSNSKGGQSGDRDANRNANRNGTKRIVDLTSSSSSDDDSLGEVQWNGGSGNHLRRRGETEERGLAVGLQKGTQGTQTRTENGTDRTGRTRTGADRSRTGAHSTPKRRLVPSIPDVPDVPDVMPPVVEQEANTNGKLKVFATEDGYFYHLDGGLRTKGVPKDYVVVCLTTPDLSALISQGYDIPPFSPLRREDNKGPVVGNLILKKDVPKYQGVMTEAGFHDEDLREMSVL